MKVKHIPKFKSWVPTEQLNFIHTLIGYAMYWLVSWVQSEQLNFIHVLISYAVKRHLRKIRVQVFTRNLTANEGVGGNEDVT